MPDKIKDKMMAIINDQSFNKLSFDQRNDIYKFLLKQQIQTLWQVMHYHPDLMCGAYKAKIKNWLHQCVADYEAEYGIPKGD